MISLSKGCYCSELSVFPKNWKSKKADMTKPWYIKYRFYDPSIKDANGKVIPKQKVLKNMNSFKTWESRKAATETLLQNELHLLKKNDYNAFQNEVKERATMGNPTAETPFCEAVSHALKGITIDGNTRRVMRPMIENIISAAKKINYDLIPVGNVSRRHIRAIFDQCKEMQAGWSANLFNAYRAYLGMIYNELDEYEAVQCNVPYSLKKQKTIKKIRETLTNDQRVRVNAHLRDNYYSFWRFLQVFFHSGSRETEMVCVQYDHVNLIEQKFRVTIKKGKVTKEVWRPIKDIALPLWREIMSEANAGQFLFSKGLVPGGLKINAHQITKRWRVHVKQKLNVTADFYSLKHSNLDETAAILSLQDASIMAGHTSTIITMKHYAHGEKDRQNERLRKVSNSFA